MPAEWATFGHRYGGQGAGQPAELGTDRLISRRASPGKSPPERPLLRWTKPSAAAARCPAVAPVPSWLSSRPWPCCRCGPRSSCLATCIPIRRSAAAGPPGGRGTAPGRTASDQLNQPRGDSGEPRSAGQSPPSRGTTPRSAPARLACSPTSSGSPTTRSASFCTATDLYAERDDLRPPRCCWSASWPAEPRPCLVDSGGDAEASSPSCACACARASFRPLPR